MPAHVGIQILLARLVNANANRSKMRIPCTQKEGGERREVWSSLFLARGRLAFPVCHPSHRPSLSI